MSRAQNKPCASIRLIAQSLKSSWLSRKRSASPRWLLTSKGVFRLLRLKHQWKRGIEMKLLLVLLIALPALAATPPKADGSAPKSDPKKKTTDMSFEDVL